MTTRGYQYDGDPLVTITQEGADLTYVAGQPVMDRGLENAGILSLFTSPDWAGNALLTGQGESLGSLFERIATGTRTITLTTMDQVADIVRKFLTWMVPAKIAGKIEVSVTNPAGHYLAINVAIYPPGGGAPSVLAITRNGPNWAVQKEDPAHGRIPEE